MPRRMIVVSFFLVILPLGVDAQSVRRGHFVTSDGVRLHYLEAGQGPAMVFVPGWTMPAEIWEHQIEHFSKTHRVVALDPRSQGRSAQATEGHFPDRRGRDVKELVDALNLAPAVLVGWSMGVNELVAYVDQFGTDTVAALVLVDGVAGWEPDAELLKEFFGWIGGIQQDRRKTTEGFVRSMCKKSQSEDYYRRITEASLRTPTNTALALLLGSMVNDKRAGLAKIDKPTLITVAPGPYFSAYEDMHRRIAGSRMETFEDSGHALFVDEADRFNALLADFLRRLSPPVD